MPDDSNKTEANWQRNGYGEENSWKILVVDDHDMNLSLMTTVLERFGCQVITAQTGESGVRLALEQEVDLVFMDIQLPDISGIEAMKRITAKRTAKVPIVALTAYAMKEDKEKMKTEGFDGYILKPIDINLVKKTVTDMVVNRFSGEIPS